MYECIHVCVCVCVCVCVKINIVSKKYSWCLRDTVIITITSDVL